MIIALIGLRASGKSTVGPRLARVLGVPFTDLDVAVAARLGFASAGDAFAADQGRFREAEAACLRELLARGPCVLALGGGTPEAPGVPAMFAAARVVYLRASPATLRARLARAPVHRPSITGAGTLEEVEAVWRRRDPLYRELAEAVIDVDTLSEKATLARLVEVARGSPRGG